MEKKSWLWKRKSSERSPGETESSGSISSQSERYSDEQVEQESLKASMNHMQSPEVTSKVAITNGEIDDNIKSLTEKLSAALVNVGAKEDLVKQHAKVAEEAVAGWEKAENEVAALKQQLEAAVQQNLALEVRVNHLDGALKECVKQLRQAREEQEQRIGEIVAEKTREWELTEHELQTKLLDLQAQSEANQLEHHPPIDPDVLLKLEALQKENSILRFELLSQSEELEIRTIERDLSTQAAETASKQQLESIKKVAKLEAECRRLQLVNRKSPSVNDQKAVSVSSLYVDSLTDSQSDSGEKLNALEVDTLKSSRAEHNGSEQSCSDSWASALIAELDQFKNGKTLAKNVTSCEIDNIMDDFLEMERLASLPETQSNTEVSNLKTEDSSFKAELEASNHRVAELEDKLLIIEAEKAKLENALSVTRDSLAACQDSLAASNVQLVETKSKLDDLQKELAVVNESKVLLEFGLVSMEAEAKTMSADINMLKADVEKERNCSSEMTVKCQDLEKELMKKTEEVKLQQAENTYSESKVKQEDLAVAAADRLSECQKTISSLARQLESLATLEDFLIDTANIPGLSGGSSIPCTGGELWKLHSNDTFMPKSTGGPSKLAEENFGHLANGNAEDSPASSSSSTSSVVSLNHVGVPSKGKSSFGRLFSRSKSGIQVESYQG